MSNVSNILNINSVEKYLLFSWIDYTVFSLMLLISTIIGIYFWLYSKQDTMVDYLMGGKTMSILPISASLVASYLSAISVLGIPTEMYMYGTAYWMFPICSIIAALFTSFITLPIFFKFQLYSCYEYLQLRFNKSLRILSSVLSIIPILTYLPLVVYTPALALNQVTEINIYYITSTVTLVCIFYTTVGGLRSVVWTDTIQVLIMMITMITVLFLGLQKVESIKFVWDMANKGGRIDFFNMDPSLTTRSSFLAIIIGLTGVWIGEASFNQATIQKCLSLPKITKAIKAIFLFCFGVFCLNSICCFIGLMMYVHYKNCDPYTEGKVERPDQLLPYYVMEITKNVPGLPGLFVAGIFSAALSTMSTYMNTIAGLIYEDLISHIMPPDVTESRASNIMKVLVVIIGVVSFALVFVIEKLGAILQLSYSLGGMSYGPRLGLFILGIFFPWANAKGALIGGIVSIIFVGTISIGAQIHTAQGNLKFPPLPLSTEECSVNNLTLLQSFNTTTSTLTNITANEEINVFYLFRISYLYYTPIGMITVLIVGLLVSWMTGWEDLSKLNPDLISPIIQNIVSKRIKKSYPNDYCSVECALENNQE